ncbi:MAG: hypothetical protein EXS23_00020 [Pedosphaera sp.]|nr:hypothetical protein [Pedosphaera sp.]
MNCKTVWLTITGVLLINACGCGGFSGSHSISPTSLFLSGVGTTAVTQSEGAVLPGTVAKAESIAFPQ